MWGRRVFLALMSRRVEEVRAAKLLIGRANFGNFLVSSCRVRVSRMIMKGKSPVIKIRELLSVVSTSKLIPIRLESIREEMKIFFFWRII